MSQFYNGYPQAPSYGPSAQLGQLSAIGVMQQQANGLSASSTAAGHYGHPMYNGYPAMPPPSASAGMPSSGPSTTPPWQAELASHLVRLEGALSSLKPQIEAALLSNPQQQQQQQNGASMHTYAALLQQQQQLHAAQQQQRELQQRELQQASKHSSPPPAAAGSSDDVAVSMMSPPKRVGSNSDLAKTPNSLSSRRGFTGGLAIDTAPKAKPTPVTVPMPVPQPDPAPQPAVVAAPSALKQSPRFAAPEVIRCQSAPETILKDVPQSDKVVTVEAKAEDKSGAVGRRDERPVVNINPVRVAPAIQDPQSPRSPGRFSAWK